MRWWEEERKKGRWWEVEGETEEEEEDEVVEPERRKEGEIQESEQTGRVAAERGVKQATETAEWAETSTEGWVRVVEWRDEEGNCEGKNGSG